MVGRHSNGEVAEANAVRPRASAIICANAFADMMRTENVGENTMRESNLKRERGVRDNRARKRSPPFVFVNDGGSSDQIVLLFRFFSPSQELKNILLSILPVVIAPAFLRRGKAAICFHAGDFFAPAWAHSNANTP
jgi:hypothetical protein